MGGGQVNSFLTHLHVSAAAANTWAACPCPQPPPEPSGPGPSVGTVGNLGTAVQPLVGVHVWLCTWSS